MTWEVHKRSCGLENSARTGILPTYSTTGHVSATKELRAGFDSIRALRIWKSDQLEERGLRIKGEEEWGGTEMWLRNPKKPLSTFVLRCLRGMKHVAIGALLMQLVLYCKLLVRLLWSMYPVKSFTVMNIWTKLQEVYTVKPNEWIYIYILNKYEILR
jgi:hypothetical protein